MSFGIALHHSVRLTSLVVLADCHCLLVNFIEDGFI